MDRWKDRWIDAQIDWLKKDAHINQLVDSAIGYSFIYTMLHNMSRF